MSSRPVGVATLKMRRPHSSNGVTARMPPIWAIRLPLVATRWGMPIFSIAGSGACSTASTRRLGTKVRVRPSSQTRIGVASACCRSAKGSVLTPATLAKLPASSRPSSSRTRSAMTWGGHKAAARRAARVATRREHGGCRRAGIAASTTASVGWEAWSMAHRRQERRRGERPLT